mgnify:CR=1 FL=1
MIKKHWFIQNEIKERAEYEDMIRWAKSPTPKLPKKIKYPKPSYDKESMTFRTAMYAFIRQLRP